MNDDIFSGEIRESDIKAVVKNDPKITLVTIDGENLEEFIQDIEESSVFFHMSGKPGLFHTILRLPPSCNVSA